MQIHGSFPQKSALRRLAQTNNRSLNKVRFNIALMFVHERMKRFFIGIFWSSHDNEDVTSGN